jgi:hypothetical protein
MFGGYMTGLRLLLCSVIVVMSFALPRVVFGDEMDTLTDKALKVCGMTGQLDDLGNALISAVPADAFPSAKMQGDAKEFVKKSASKNALLEIVRSVVRTEVDRETLEKVIAFYDSKLGRKVGRLHETSLEPTMLKNIREGRKVLAASEDSRVGLLKRIIDSDNAAETNKLLLKTVIRGLLEGYAGDTPDTTNDGELAKEKLKIMFEAVRTDGYRTKELALAAYAYTYRSLEDKELEELAAFRESPPAMRFGAAVRKGLEGAAYTIAKSFAEAATKWRAAPASGDSGNSPEKSRELNGAGNR